VAAHGGEHERISSQGSDLRDDGTRDLRATAAAMSSTRVVVNFCRTAAIGGSAMASPPAMLTSILSSIMLRSFPAAVAVRAWR
jgi:hypothetical protein